MTAEQKPRGCQFKLKLARRLQKQFLQKDETDRKSNVFEHIENKFVVICA